MKRWYSPIRCYAGLNGMGKTLLAVHDALREGKPILSTVKINHELYVPLESLEQLATAKHCHVLLDEVAGIANAREYASMPPELQLFLKQLRKGQVTLSYTSPSFEDADITLRRVTRTITICNRVLATPRKGDFPQLVLGRATTYDMQSYEKQEGPNPKRHRKTGVPLPPKVVNRAFYRPAHMDVPYDTREEVLRVAIASKGTCITCGGRRSQPPCKCSVLPLHKHTPATPADTTALPVLT